VVREEYAMRALRVLGLADGVPGASRNLLLEDPASGEQFSTRCDERLIAATRGDLSRFGQSELESESQLRPKEIQARIRAGATVEQIATLAGTSLTRVERFAYPVLLERASMVEKALKARPAIDGITAGASVAETVAATLAARGHDGSIRWDAYKDDDGWVLALTWSAGRSENQAHWLFHPGPDGGTLSARDEAAAEIVDPALRILRPLRQVRPEASAPQLLDPIAPTVPTMATDLVHRPSEAASRSAHPAGGKLRSPAARVPELPHPRSTSGSTPFGRQPLPTSLAGSGVGVGLGGVGLAGGNAERVLVEPVMAEPTVTDRVTEDLLRDDRSGVSPVMMPVEAVRTGTEPVTRSLPSGPSSTPVTPAGIGAPTRPAVAAASSSAAATPAVAAPTAAAPAAAVVPAPVVPTAATRPSPPARPVTARGSGTVPGTARAAKRGNRPAMPSWEDVLLGTRSDKTAGR
jgi:hypothetical protein